MKKSPGRPRNEESHRLILDAAFSMLQLQGYAQTSIEGIAKNAGVAKQTIYRRWSGKADLFLDVLKVQAEQRGKIPDSGDIEKDLVSLLSTAFKIVSEHLKPLMKALAIEALQDDAFAEKIKTVFVEGRRQIIHKLCEKAWQRGDFVDKPNADILCDLLYGPMWYRILFDHQPINKEEAVLIVKTVLRTVSTQ